MRASGSSEMGPKSGVRLEAVSFTTKSFNHRSASGTQYRCSYFGHAFVTDITANPTSRVRIDLMRGHAPNPDIITSMLPPESQLLTHWMLTTAKA